MTEIYIQVGSPYIEEGSSFTATANFSDTPTTAQYRVDCLTTGKTITDWTDLTPASSNSITVTATHNAIQRSGNSREKKQLTVQTNEDTSTQTRDSIKWVVINNEAF